MAKVDLGIEGGIAEIRLDNPEKLNVLTAAMLADLSAHLETIERRDDVRVVLVTSVGSRAFCAGADINAWGDLSPAEFARRWVRDGHRLFDRLARLSKPTIAAIGGHALGGGLELAAACDIRVMAPGATLGLPEARIGMVPGWSGTQRLARLLPEPTIREMALFGRRLSAERAHALGFAAEIAEDALAAAAAIAREAAALSPRAVEIAKTMINAAAGEDMAAMVEALGAAAVSASADRVEGVAAFRAKRSPRFTGA